MKNIVKIEGLFFENLRAFQGPKIDAQIRIS